MHRRAAALAFGIGLTTPAALAAQADASLGVGAGTTRYAGGAAFSSVAFSPSVLYAAPARSLEGGGAVASLPAGDWAAQVRVDLWAGTPARAAIGPAVALTAAGTAQTGGPGTGQLQVLGEAVWAPGREGLALGLGPSVGGVAGDEGLAGVRGRLRGWMETPLGLATAAVEVHATTEGGFSEAAAGFTTLHGPVAASGWLAARMAGGAVRAGARAALDVALAPRVTLEAAAGRALADPWQGFPAVSFLSFAVRVHTAPSPMAQPSRPALPTGPRMERRGDSVLVRFRVRGAVAVAIAGEWSDWTPVALIAEEGGVWVARLGLAPGTYRFNLVLDGGSWTVPDGVAAVDDGMGSRVGLLVVP